MNIDLIKKYIKPLTPLPTGLEQTGSLEDEIQCILFDVYGTLLISGSGDIGVTMSHLENSSGLIQLMHEYQIHISPNDLLKRFFQSITKSHDIKKKKGILHPEVKIDEIWMTVLENTNVKHIRRFSVEFEMMVNPVYPMPHLSAVLKACRNQKIHMGMVSNAQFYTPLLFKFFLGSEPQYLGFHRELMIYSFEFGHAKPSPLLFQTVLKRLRNLDIHKEQVLYVGNDMLNDIYPADSVGFKTALFAGDNRSLRMRETDKRCKNLKPDLIITELDQLIQYL